MQGSPAGHRGNFNKDDREETERLLSRIALRDAAALKALYRLVASRLMAVAWRVVQDRALAEDVLQEVFLIGIGRSLTAPPSHTTGHTGHVSGGSLHAG